MVCLEKTKQDIQISCITLNISRLVVTFEIPGFSSCGRWEILQPKPFLRSVSLPFSTVHSKKTACELPHVPPIHLISSAEVKSEDSTNTLFSEWEGTAPVPHTVYTMRFKYWGGASARDSMNFVYSSVTGQRVFCGFYLLKWLCFVHEDTLMGVLLCF